MASRLSALGVAFVPVIVALTGCHPDLMLPSMGDVKAFARLERDGLDRHDRNMTDQHQLMAPEVSQQLLEQRRLFTEHLNEISVKADALEAKHAALIRDVLLNAGNILGLPDKLTNALTTALVPKIDEAKQEAVEAMATAKLVSDRVNTVGINAASLQNNVEEVKAALSRLDVEMRDKLAQADQATLDRLMQIKDDRARFEQVLRDELKLSPGEIENLKGMTTDEILALVLAACGAATAGGALGKTGKSRGQGDIDRLKDTVNRLSIVMERKKPA